MPALCVLQAYPAELKLLPDNMPLETPYQPVYQPINYVKATDFSLRIQRQGSREHHLKS